MVVKFLSERYPLLHIKLPCRKHVRFEGGLFLTDDEQIILELRGHSWYGSLFNENRPAEWVVKTVEEGGSDGKEKVEAKEEQEVLDDGDLSRILI